MLAPRRLPALLLMLSVQAGVLGATSQAAPSPTPGELIARFSADYRGLAMGELNLSYKAEIESLVHGTDIAAQRKVFDAYARQLRAVDAQAATSCQQRDLKLIDFEVVLNQKKLDLIEQYKALGDKAVLSNQGLYATSLGSQWYAYLRMRWLTMATTPESLKSLGEAQLESALRRYRQLQAKMGYAGRDQQFAAHLAGAEFYYPAGQTPEADYKTRQAIVFARLDQLFPAKGIAPPVIKGVARGADFPADAYYEPDEKTFYFNQTKPSLDRRNVDYLLLHESMPGHHYQFRYAAEHSVCPAVLPEVFYSAYAEGWGAYVEEYGGRLGLYQQASDELGAVEWDLVRSIRVILDVGINQEGWSPQQALDYWHARLPMLPQLAERETMRVRNWPVQAITYKLGQYEIRRLRDLAKAREGEKFDLRAFHERILRHGAMPLALLETITQGAPP